MHVALVTNDIGFGSGQRIPSGMSVYTSGLAHQLYRTQDCRVSVLVPVSEGQGHLAHGCPEWMNVTSFVVGRHQSPVQSWLEFGTIVHDWCVQHRPSVIESHHHAAPLFVEQFLGGTPTVIRYASDRYDSALAGGVEGFRQLDRSRLWDQHLLEVLTVKNADLVTCAGSRQMAKAEALGARSMLELPLGVEDTETPPVEVSDEAKKAVLLLVTRFSDPRKGAEYVGPILQAIPPDFHVHVVGELDVDKREAMKTAHPGLRTWHFDPISKSDLDRLRSETCATIVPSKSESFGLALLEPMLAGRPTICFTQMDASKREWPLFNLGRCSIESCAQVAQAVKTAADPREAMFKSMRKFAEGFLWENLIERYLLAYERAAAAALAGGRTRGW